MKTNHWKLGVLGAALLAASGAMAQAVVGKPAPAFTATDLAGKPVALSDFKGKYVVLEWTNPECPFVKKHYDSGNLPATQKDATAKGVVWLSIQTVPAADPKARSELQSWQATKHAAATASVIDDGSIGKAYRAATTPHMYIVDPQGRADLRRGHRQQAHVEPRGHPGRHELRQPGPGRGAGRQAGEPAGHEGVRLHGEVPDLTPALGPTAAPNSSSSRRTPGSTAVAARRRVNLQCPHCLASPGERPTRSGPRRSPMGWTPLPLTASKCQSGECAIIHERSGAPIMKVTTVGLDLAKKRVPGSWRSMPHGHRKLFNRQLRRGLVVADVLREARACAWSPWRPVQVLTTGRAACGTWARRFG